jgi:hypothetical protein
MGGGWVAVLGGIGSGSNLFLVGLRRTGRPTVASFFSSV